MSANSAMAPGPARWRTLLVPLVLAVALLPSAYVAWLSPDMPQVARIHDAGLYWVCAKSLAQGSGYRIISLPDQPYQTKYPPLYPLALSLVWRLNPAFPQNLQAAALLSWLVLPVYIFLARRLFSDLGIAPVRSAVLCAILALNPYTILYGTNLMTEVPFSCLLFASCCTMTVAARPRSSGWFAFGAGVLGGLAYLTRTAALPLVATGPLFFFLRRQASRAALFLCGLLPAVAAWHAWAGAHLNQSTDPHLLYYTDYVRYVLANFGYSDVPMIIWRNAADLLTGAGTWITGMNGPVLFLRLLAALALIGAFRFSSTARRSAYFTFAAGYVAILLVWQLGDHIKSLRLLIPVMPLLLAGLASEACRAAAWIRRPAKIGGPMRLFAIFGTACMFVVTCLLLATNSALLASFPAYVRGERARVDGYRRTYDWSSRNLPPRSAVLAESDTLFYLYTGHPACSRMLPPRLLYTNDAAGVARFIAGTAEYARQQDVPYIVLDADRAGSGPYRMLGEVVAARSGLRLIHDGALAVFAVEGAVTNASDSK